MRRHPSIGVTLLPALLALSILTFAAAACLFVSAREVVLVLLGDAFLGAVPLVRIFSVFIPFAVLASLSGTLAEATARLDVKIGIQAGYVAALLAGFWGAHAAGWGVTGFAVALTVATALRAFALEAVARRILGGGGRDIVRAYVLGPLLAAPVGLALHAAAAPLRAANTPAFALLAVEAALGAALLGALVVFGPESELRRLARRALSGLTRRIGAPGPRA